MTAKRKVAQFHRVWDKLFAREVVACAAARGYIVPVTTAAAQASVEVEAKRILENNWARKRRVHAYGERFYAALRANEETRDLAFQMPYMA